MKKNKQNIFIGVSFLIIVFGLSIINVKNLKTSIAGNLNGQNIDTLKQCISSIEDSYRNSFVKKDKFIDLYGIVQKALNKKMIGNFEFIQDDYGIMHMFKGEGNVIQKEEELKYLNELSKKFNTPFLYVQEPEKEIENYNELKALNIDPNKEIDDIIESLIKNNIDYIDIRKILDKAPVDKSNIYFKTDVHMQTETEFWIMQEVVNTLEEKYGIEFEEKNFIFDQNNYNIIDRPFMGNLSKSSGKYYTNIDNFRMLIPNFNTDYSLRWEDNSPIKEGSFQYTILNGAELDGNNGYNQYWVTNYLQWPTACYRIENHNNDKNNILVIMDSNSIRFTSYLSLLCKNITIIDPRYQGNENLIEKELEKNKYDAVIMLQGTGLNMYDLFPKDYDKFKCEIISENVPRDVRHDEKYNFNVVVKNVGTELWSNDENIKLCIKQDGIDLGYRLELPDGVIINPEEEYTFTLEGFQVPDKRNTYLEFMMVKEGIKYFGEPYRIDILAK